MLADQIAQIAVDAAAQNAVVTGAFTDVSTAISGLQTQNATILAQLQALQNGADNADLGAVIAAVEANTASAQKIKDAADAAIAALTPPATTPPITA